ncbi:MAG: hypothetical protein WKF52_00120 [Sphingomicrobium sp.]
MADPKSGLPEGTDRIIDGAMETAKSTAFEPEQLVNTGAVSATGKESGITDKGTASIDAADLRSTGGAGALLDKVRSGGEKLSVQAADKARGLVGQGLERSSEALANVSKLVGETAGGLDERLGEDYGNYARRAAGAIENAASNLAAKDPDELVDDTRNFIRKSPGVALAGAAIAGFTIARLIKSGLSKDESDDGDRKGRGRKRS